VQLGDIVRLHGEALRRAHVLTPQQHAALRAIERCRTAALGGHLDVCLQCGHAEPAYNSCRNRHCPKCQALAQARWVAARSARILPTHYFHVVFTLPAELRALARANPHELFDMVFAAASETLLELGRDSRWLGAQLGVTAVLHTWTRELVFHPHVHCIVTGGGLTDDGSAWRSARKNCLVPVHVMGALFRGKTISKIRRAQQRGRLELGSSSPQQLRDTLDRLQAIDWIVYAKRPFGGALQVVRYLGRYTHRAGISNQRLVSLEDDKVTFRISWRRVQQRRRMNGPELGENACARSSISSRPATTLRGAASLANLRWVRKARITRASFACASWPSPAGRRPTKGRARVLSRVLSATSRAVAPSPSGGWVRTCCTSPPSPAIRRCICSSTRSRVASMR
jgi:hypothetical protein